MQQKTYFQFLSHISKTKNIFCLKATQTLAIVSELSVVEAF